MGSVPEAPLSAEIETAMGRKAVNLAGRTTVREVMALLASCSFLLTNDSGPMHIGAAFGVPLVAIFGPTDWRKTSPWTKKARIVRVDVDCSSCHRRECDRGHECMVGVTADMVIAAARELMAEVRGYGAAGGPEDPRGETLGAGGCGPRPSRRRLSPQGGPRGAGGLGGRPAVRPPARGESGPAPRDPSRPQGVEEAGGGPGCPPGGRGGGPGPAPREGRPRLRHPGAREERGRDPPLGRPLAGRVRPARGAGGPESR